MLLFLPCLNIYEKCVDLNRSEKVLSLNNDISNKMKLQMTKGVGKQYKQTKLH